MRLRIALLVLVALGACSSRSSVPEGEHAAIRYLLPDDYVEIMEGADRLVVYALNPAARDAPPCGEHLGEPIVASVEERDRDEIRRTARDVYEAILDAGGSSMCMQPELSLRFERSDRSIELVVCEECNMAWLYVDDAEHRPSMSVARLRRRRWPATAAALRRRCGVAPLWMDTQSAALFGEAQAHGGSLEAGTCCETTR